MRRKTQSLKDSQLRHAKYYGAISIGDNFYQDSLKGKVFRKLMNAIISEENILLAYRNIKRNRGSLTKGVDGLTIADVEQLSQDDYISKVRQRFAYYKPKKVRRVEIPKPNGKKRPLGIPSIWDRLAQQCILQILEPICEAKFYKHSYGFRPNCSAEQAINDCMIRMNISRMNYVVDIDIKGFFDEVNHTKLMRQLWSLGIRDKQLLVIIRRMLKAPVVLPNKTTIYPQKGTPQGGILSPLLANIVLNEFDWWIASQWENHKVDEVKPYYRKDGTRAIKHEYERLRKTTSLKEVYIVRYADDFKLFTTSKTNAEKLYHATKQWLWERLKLPISPEKSKITNLYKEKSEFLGFTLKLERKGKRYVCQSHIAPKALEQIRQQLKAQIEVIRKQPSAVKIAVEVEKYNSKVAGIHQYYQIATQVNEDVQSIGREVLLRFHHRFDCVTKEGKYMGKNKIVMKYLTSKMMRYFFGAIPIIPVGYVRHSHPMGKKRSINKYTVEGRKLIHRNQKQVFEWQLDWLRNHPITGKRGSVLLNDNRLSLFVAQGGKCGVTGQLLEMTDIHCHHKIPWAVSHDDSYHNLILVSARIHKLIHMKDRTNIHRQITQLGLSRQQLKKLNELRQLVGNQSVGEKS